MSAEDIARLKNYISIEHNVPAHIAHLALSVGLIAQSVAATAMLESREERIQNAVMITTLLNDMWRQVCSDDQIAEERFTSMLRTVAEHTLPADMVKMIYDKRSNQHGH